MPLFGAYAAWFYIERPPFGRLPRVVIFCHGLGPGQCAYTTEIAYFCSCGYAVLALDSRGCGLSDGKSPRGLEAGIYSAVAAYRLAKRLKELKNLKVFFAGHSMGSYASLCAVAICKADGAIAFAAPEAPPLTVCNLAARTISRPLAALVRPFLRAFARLYVGRYANMRASKALKKAKVPTIIFQGDKDSTVPLMFSAYSYCKDYAQCVLCGGRGQYPYNTVRAEQLPAELGNAVANARKMGEEERSAYFSSVNYTAVCQEDDSVMSAAADFIASVLSQGN